MSSKTEAEDPGRAAFRSRRPAGPRSLAWRLTLWYAISAFAIVAATTMFLYFAQKAQFRREGGEFLMEHVRILRNVLRDRPNDLAALRQEVEHEAEEGIYIRVLDAGGKTLVETPQMGRLLPSTLFPSAAGPATFPEGVFIMEGAGRKSFSAIIGTDSAAGGDAPRHSFHIAFDRTAAEAALAEFRNQALPVLFLALISCIALGYPLARRGLRPLKEISQRMLHIRASTLDERVDAESFPSELSELAATFNGMLDRLEEAFGRLSRFSADLAHELRTPINNLRGEVEVALGRSRSTEDYRETLGSCLEECVRLSRIIDNLLFLARAENPSTKVRRDRVDLSKELDSVKEYYEPAATERQVSLHVECAPGSWAYLDRMLLQRALGNLVDNSFRHTPSGGSIRLSAEKSGESVLIGVADTGCGIGEENLPRVFDRFFRADPSRSASTGGMGLGLALVKGIAEMHGGNASIESERGKGTRVVLSLPFHPDGED